MVVTELGIETETNHLQPQNADSPKEVTESGIVIEVNP